MTYLKCLEDKRCSVRKRLKKYFKKTCSVKTVKKRIPIVQWLPRYNLTSFIQDMIAGVTVGLTAIPQGIAYAVVAGLSPEYGLYSGLVGGLVYLFFGSCKDITVGPTAIMSTLVAKYVSGYSSDFAVLAAFLAGLTELVMGILHLGFLVEFISQPVVCGFTTSAALQIASSQLKSLLGLAGSSGNYFAESIINFTKNIKTVKLWDSILGFNTIIILVILKRMGQGCKRTDGLTKQLRWFFSLARNAVVVIMGIIVAVIVKVLTSGEPLTLIGEIGSGLPSVQLPPFSTMVGNETYSFTDMARALGPESVILPLVAILESVAIAKVFAAGVSVDATQEMIALGLCNIFGSFFRSMPVTGSFTRSALNNASGVQTPAGGIFTGLLIILALSLLTSIFYYIPKATLAGLIITAMFSMIDYTIFIRLWRHNKRELIILLFTIAVCLSIGLEYGIVSGIVLEAVILLFITSRPIVEVSIVNDEKENMIKVPLFGTLSYCAAEHVRRAIFRVSRFAQAGSVIIVDGTNLRSMDSTVASNLMSVVSDLEKNSLHIFFLNFKSDLISMCVNIDAESQNLFVTASDSVDVIRVIREAQY